MDDLTIDQLQQRLMANRELISRVEGDQLELLEALDRLQIATADGCRSLAEWVAMTLDVGSDTAKSLVRTMRRTAERPDLRESLAAGASFDGSRLSPASPKRWGSSTVSMWPAYAMRPRSAPR